MKITLLSGHFKRDLLGPELSIPLQKKKYCLALFSYITRIFFLLLSIFELCELIMIIFLMEILDIVLICIFCGDYILPMHDLELLKQKSLLKVFKCHYLCYLEDIWIPKRIL